MRRILMLILALTLAVGLAASASALYGFDDVPQGAWYANNVEAVVESGLMKGVSPTEFDANGTVSCAQGVAIAARLRNDHYSGIRQFVQGDPWYKVYVDYLAEDSYMTSDDFYDYGAPITRGQFALLLYDCSPQIKTGDFINTVQYLPDVDAGSEYYRAVSDLYRLGACVGDENAKFYPDKTITRAEAAAIITRILDSSLRLSVELKDRVTPLPTVITTPEKKPEPVSLFDLIADGSVTVSATSSSMSGVTLYINNNTEEFYDAYVPAGSWMRSSKTFQQNLLILDTSSFTIFGGIKTTQTLDAACMNFSKDIPDGTGSFTLQTGAEDKLKKLVEYFNETSWPEYGVRQAAVWIITDNATRSDCASLMIQSYYGGTFIGTSRAITDENYDEAKALVNSLK